MGGFWDDSNKQDDPTKKLAPELQDFLKQQTPTTYTTTSASPSKETPAPPSQRETRPTEWKYDVETPEEKPKVPAASLFQDGRYAHLWKTYKPLSEIEDGQSVDAVKKLVEQFKQRKSTVHYAAMENCAVEHEAQSQCYNTNDWWSMVKARATMCSDENRKFSRCYTTQAKFLQALGYASSVEWDEDREERIQMHADKLYHQMLDYENQVAEARAAGVEPPPITSLFNPTAKPIPANDDDKSLIPGGQQLPKGYKPRKPLEKLTPHERELEVESVNAEIENKKKYAEQAGPLFKKHMEVTEKRTENATKWFGETIGKWLN